MNSLLQSWYMTPEIRHALYILSPEHVLNVAHIKATEAEVRKLSKSHAPRKVPLHLQKLFTKLQLSDEKSVATSELTTEGFGWKDGDARVQHDLDALYLELVDAVNQSLRKTSGEDLTRRLLQVQTTSTVETLTDPVFRSPSTDQNISLQIPTIKGVPNLITALSKYFYREHINDGTPWYVDIESVAPIKLKKLLN